MKIDWVRKLSSRKFWVAVAGLISGLIIYFGGSTERATATEGIVMSIASIVVYLLAEGITDAAYSGKHLDEDE